MHCSLLCKHVVMGNECRPSLVQFENENMKIKILSSMPYLLQLTKPYSGIYVSVDMTKLNRKSYT